MLLLCSHRTHILYFNAHKEEGKNKSTPLYSNQQTAARDLGITRSTKPKVQSSAVITPDVKATKVTTRNSFAALPSDSVTTAEVIVEPKVRQSHNKIRERGIKHAKTKTLFSEYIIIGERKNYS